MKLAEALQERADINRKIESLQDRIATNALVQEGETPAEDPQELKKELDEAVERLANLMASINLTNSQTVADGQCLTKWIAHKDALNVKLSAYRSVLYAAGHTVDRARNSEIKIKQTVNVRAWQAEVDAIAKELRETDNRLQAANWSTDLKEI